MRSLVVLVCALAVRDATAEGSSPLQVTQDGWTIAADPQQAVVSVAHERWGPLLDDARLQVRGEQGLKRLAHWTVRRQGANRLVVQTTNPITGWVFHLTPNTLAVSSTVANAVLTATTRAPRDRLIARLLDPQGVPVVWQGIDDLVLRHGASLVTHPSFLPRRNPEVMYFSLGQVAAATLHSLFDRRSDTAVRFSEDTRLTRNDRNQDLLDVTMPIPGNTMLHVMPDYFARTLGVPFYVPFDDTHFPTAPMVWSSWTSYFSEVHENDIVANADWLATHLRPYGFQYVQLDDGYDRGAKGEHSWIGTWDRAKFPRGPKWLADHVKSKGLRPGLWVVPNSYAGAVSEHPHWYLRDKQGELILNYSTPALDHTNPEVLEFLKTLFTTLGSWGFEYYKFDGEFALPQYLPHVDCQRLHDPEVDPVVAYRRRLAVIREVIGPKTFVEACPSGTPLDGIGYFQSYFHGYDVYNSWQGMHSLFSSINAHAFLNHLVVYVMPGEGLELGLPMTVEEAQKRRRRRFVEVARSHEAPLAGFGVTLAQARTEVSLVALSGVTYPLASVMPELPEERVRLLQSTMPTMPILPVDLFSRGSDMKWDLFKRTTADYYVHNYPEILDLKVNAPSGVYDVVALINWRSKRSVRELTFADKLGLDAQIRHVVFDFWNRRLLGVFQDRITLEIDPHDTRVLLIHPLLNRPQLVGLSRHITAAYSILELTWDPTNAALRGRSETVASDPYTLWIHVPAGFTACPARARTASGRDLPVRQHCADRAMEVSFTGQEETVTWEIPFGHDTPAPQ